MDIIKKVTIFIFISLLHSQFKPDFINSHKEDRYIEMEEHYDEDQNGRLKHWQRLSMSLSLKRGSPLSLYSYTNIFNYKVREDLVADVKIHGRFSNSIYQPSLSGGKYLSPHLAMDAGIKYSPFNNGVFDLHIRTFHDQWWSGQSAYLSFLGIPIKRLYKSKSFNRYQGPSTWNR